MPVGLAVAGANRHDMKRTRDTLESVVVPRPEPTAEPPQGLGLDQGFECGPELSRGCGSLGLLAQRQQAGDGQMGSAGIVRP